MTSRPFLSICFLLSALVTPSAMLAQGVASTGATTPPTQGVGHDYIDGLQETVDPSSGQVSLRLNVPVPEGRGLTLPFAFAYDSASINYAGETWNEQIAGEYHGAWYDNWSPIQQNGWSYTIPATIYNQTTRNLKNSQGQNVPCQQFTGYTFQDPKGGSHNLRMGFIPQVAPCNQISLYTSGGDAQITATMMQNGNPLPGGISLVEQDGTVYGPSAASLTYSVASGHFLILIPQAVEDRNGNKIATVTTFSPLTYAVTDTLGRTALNVTGFGTTGNSVTVSGLGAPYTLTWETLSIPSLTSTSTSVGQEGTPYCNGVGTAAGGGGTGSVVEAIALPNGQQYTFSYDSTYGALNRITYPSGGYVSYTWGMNTQSASLRFGNNYVCAFIYDKPAILHRYVSFDGTTVALQQDFYYSTTWNPTTSGQPYLWQTKTTKVVTTIKTPDGRSTSNTAIYTYQPWLAAGGWVNTPPGYDSNPAYTPPGTVNLSNADADVQIPLEQNIVYQDSTGTTLRTITKNWLDPYRITKEQTTLENGLTTETDYTYGIGMQVTEKDDYDYGSGGRGSLLRKTSTTYQAFAATPLYPTAPSIASLPSTVIEYDGAGNKVAETDYIYDGTAVVSPCGGCTLTGHDESKYPPSVASPRGNLTKRTKWLNAGGTSPVENYTYDETGQKLSYTNANNNTTTYSYLDVYAAGTPPNQTDAYLTKTTYPSTANANHIETFSYAYADGKLIVSTDQNGKQTVSTYNDNFRRLTEIDYSDGGQVTYVYCTLQKLNACQV
jgi:hypothetical protein